MSDTLKAQKRVVFFGRYEASQYGSPEIKAEHLLLGLFRSDRGLSRRVLGCGGPIKRFISSASAINSIRCSIFKHSLVGPKISNSVDIPLSNESKLIAVARAKIDLG